ncbi:MAG: hypothetical protein IJL69_04205, partial [Oscillospiraceae bacterium]|nr:hypothetical protein [Oscillospiraceae bacterium]
MTDPVSPAPRARGLSKRTQLLLAFFLPLSVALIAFAVKGLAPFGGRGLMAMDGWGQYFPMIKELRRCIL